MSECLSNLLEWLVDCSKLQDQHKRKIDLQSCGGSRGSQRFPTEEQRLVCRICIGESSFSNLVVDHMDLIAVFNREA